MTDLPTANDVFGNDLPTADQAFGPSGPQKEQPGLFSGEFADTFFSHDKVGRVISAFGQGAKEGWGDDLGKMTKESDAWLSHVGVYNDYNSGRTSFIKSLNETFLRPFVYGGITAGKALGSVLGGVQKATDEAGQVLKEEYQSPVPSVIPKPLLGLGAEVIQATASGFIPDMPHFPLAARSRAVIGEGEEGFFNTHPVTEGQLQQRTQAALEAGIEPPKVEPPQFDINVIARQVNPDAFTKYDALLEEQDNLRKSRDYLKSLQTEDRMVSTYQDQQRIAGQLEDIPTRLLEIDQKIQGLVPELGDTRSRIKSYLESDSPEAETFRKYVQAELINNALKIDELRSSVEDAYGHAESLLPKAPLPSPGDLQKPVEFVKPEAKGDVPVKEETPVTSPESPRNESQKSPATELSGSTSPSNFKITKEAGLTPSSSGGLTETVGTGRVKKVGLAQKVEERAREQGLTEGFLVQERTQVSMKDQAEKASNLVENEYGRAKNIALGLEEAPEGVLPEMVFNAIEQDALEKGNIETLRQLANSTLTRQSSEMALRLRALAEREKENPVEAIREIQDARKQFVSQAKVEETVNKLKEVIEKAPENITQKDWTDWISSIECDY